MLCEISCNLCTHEFTRALIVVCVIGSVKVLLGFLHRVELMSVYIVTWLRVRNCLPTMSYPSTFTAVLPRTAAAMYARPHQLLRWQYSAVQVRTYYTSLMRSTSVARTYYGRIISVLRKRYATETSTFF